MTLRCPKCGGKRILFLSTTDGTAVGSTDQRYLCKDCDYRGAFILDDSTGRDENANKAVLEDLKKIETYVPGVQNRELLPPRMLITLLYMLLFAIIFQFVSISYLVISGGELNIALGVGFVVTLLLLVLIRTYSKNGDNKK